MDPALSCGGETKPEQTPKQILKAKVRQVMLRLIAIIIHQNKIIVLGQNYGFDVAKT